ncbi:MAG: DUF1192 domain-containing protein [Rhizobiaceae bacterium]
MFDEESPPKLAAYQVGQVIDTFSVEELDNIMARLRDEIARLQRAREAKAGHLQAAEALFGKKPPE